MSAVATDKSGKKSAPATSTTDLAQANITERAETAADKALNERRALRLQSAAS